MPAATTTKTEFRCRGKVHGIHKKYPNGEEYFEVRCKDHWCTDREPGVVVFHYFDPTTGVLHHSNKFQSPPPVRADQLESDSNER